MASEQVATDSARPDQVAAAAADGRPDLARGTAVIQAQLRTLPGSPGVYRMLNPRGDVLYVGKARNLKKRVATYASPAKLPHRLVRMVAETHAMEIVTTHTEVEALLLECNLIKRYMPRYNVLLRDDKSFANILLTGDHPFPQVAKHRGARSRPGQYFGPFASAGAVNRTITALQKAFLLRNCSDTVFASRTRPCLQYQIKRCAAPCVGYVDAAEYAALVEQARQFLTGSSRQVQHEMAKHMQAASEALHYEVAARYRDRIRALSQIQVHQDINVAGLADADVLAAYGAGGQTCVEVFFFRGGSNHGNRAYFPSHDRKLEPDAVLAAFLGQFYEDKPPPPLILLSHAVSEQGLIAEALSLRADRKVRLLVPRRGAKRKLVDHALANAREAHGRRLAESSTQRKLLEGVARAFAMEAMPERIEVYDNSHIQGRNAVGAMIVAGPEGLMKNAYRKFNIRRQAPGGESDSESETAAELGDDYAMLREVLHRRLGRALREDPERDRGSWPDLLLIDGGKGQLNVALQVLADLGIDDLAVAAIAKGRERNAGNEQFFLPGRPAFRLPPRDPVLYFLQRLRDEAHRFAIGSHRARRTKALGRSELDDVAGVGARRKRALLHHFGSVRNVARAGLADLEAVAGISKTVAKKIYDHFHREG